MQDKEEGDFVSENTHEFQNTENKESCEKPSESPKQNVAKRKKVALEELAFVRIFDPIHIPRYLVEQIKDRYYEVETFYDYQKIICLFETTNGPQLNPTNLLYVIVNEKLKQVKGFLWMVIDMLTKSLIVNNFSVDKEYWHRGEALTLLEQKSKAVMKDLNLKRIVWITKHGAFCERLGYKKSKECIMIFEPEVKTEVSHG